MWPHESRFQPSLIQIIKRRPNYDSVSHTFTLSSQDFVTVGDICEVMLWIFVFINSASSLIFFVFVVFAKLQLHYME